MFFKKKPKEPTDSEKLMESIQKKLENYDPDAEIPESTFEVDKHGIRNISEPAVITDWEDFKNEEE